MTTKTTREVQSTRRGDSERSGALRRRRVLVEDDDFSAQSVVELADGNGLVSQVREREGYTTSYVCKLSPTAALNQTDAMQRTVNMTIHTTFLLFDFEFVQYDPHEGLDEVFMQDFPKVELGILYRMASIAGLLDCDLQKQLEDPWMLSGGLSADNETTVLRPSQYLSDERLIVGLSSWSPDKPDDVGESLVLLFCWLVWK
jgi:hypothetical protein